MKRILLPVLVLNLLFATVCFAQNYVWTQKANYGGGGRYAAFGFAIGSKGYQGSGITHIGTSYTYHTDFWEYDPATNIWTQKANLSSPGRSSATGFAIGSKGYVTLGWTPSATTTTYEYDPATNIWTQKANFGGTGRYDIASFTVGNYAYVGCGYAPYLNDFWKYNPSTNSWTQIANYGGPPVSACKGFTIGSYGYVVAGGQQFSLYSNQLWRYDPVLNQWNQMTSFPGNGRVAPAAFSLNGKAFIGSGCTASLTFSDFYVYDPSNNSWTTLPNMPCQGKIHPVCFTIGNAAYVSTGVDGIYPNGLDRAEVWEYAYQTGVADPTMLNNSIDVFPNPASDHINIHLNNSGERVLKIKLFDMSGKLILTELKDVINGNAMLSIDKLAAGSYIIEVFSIDLKKIGQARVVKQ